MTKGRAHRSIIREPELPASAIVRTLCDREPLAGTVALASAFPSGDSRVHAVGCPHGGALVVRRDHRSLPAFRLDRFFTIAALKASWPRSRTTAMPIPVRLPACFSRLTLWLRRWRSPSISGYSASFRSSARSSSTGSMAAGTDGSQEVPSAHQRRKSERRTEAWRDPHRL